MISSEIILANDTETIKLSGIIFLRHTQIPSHVFFESHMHFPMKPVTWLVNATCPNANNLAFQGFQTVLLCVGDVSLVKQLVALYPSASGTRSPGLYEIIY